jgi:Type VII secretion system ESX-1, transport TM domain B
MTSRAPHKLQVSGHRFLMRRMEGALLYGDSGGDAGSVAAPRFSFAVGGVLAVVALIASAVIPALRPSAERVDTPGGAGVGQSVVTSSQPGG